MITLSDNIFASVPLPNDGKNINIILDGNNVVVETIPQFQLRVDMLSRYLGMEVPILTPPGVYEANDFVTKVNSDQIVWKKYGYVYGIEDLDLIPIVCQCSGGNDTSQWVPVSYTCDKSGVDNTGWQTVIEKLQIKDDNDNWIDADTPQRQTKYYNTTDCPVTYTIYRWVPISSTCELYLGYTNGYILTTEKQQSNVNNSEWIDTGQTRVTRSASNTCPETLYGIWVSTDFSTYDYNNEEEIVFNFGENTVFTSPVKDDYVFLFISIPADRINSFIIYDALNIPITERFSQVGTDIRPGYMPNIILKKDTVYDGLEPIYFSIKIW